MRIAVTIIAGGLTLIICLQSCGAQVGGGLSQNRALVDAGGAGWFVALLYLIGAGFAHGLPLVSVGSFALAGMVGTSVGSTTAFTELRFWGGVGWLLALLSVLGWFEKRRANRRPLRVVIAPDAGPHQPAPARPVACPACGAARPPAARFCDQCGRPLASGPAV